MKDARSIVIGFFDENDKPFWSLMRFLDTDILVQWFVEEGYVDDLEEPDKSFIQKYYTKHCY